MTVTASTTSISALSHDDKAFLDAIDAAINARAMLSHPFYQRWSRGELDLDILRDYAKQYFNQVLAFPQYVSGVYTNCDSVEARRALLENLVEEDFGDDNHPELWLRFAEGLGINRDDVLDADATPTTTASVRTLRDLTKNDDWVSGMAALYAYESQIPDVAKTKRDGLCRFYGIDDARTVSFFTVHEEADVIHREVERQLLVKHANTPEKRERVIAAAGEAAGALWGFLDGMEARHPAAHACA